MTTSTLKRALEYHFQDVATQIIPVQGGDVNQTVVVYWKNRPEMFVKFNETAPSAMFLKEAMALSSLKTKLTKLVVPEVLDTGVLDGGSSFLALHFIHTRPLKSVDFARLGEGIAELHSIHFSHFGLDYDNYIGPLSQKNEYRNTFSSFFWEMRIRPQLELAHKKKLISYGDIQRVESVSSLWEDLFPETNPSLLHGDLWIGNVLCGEKEGVSIIDPAIYFGHPEMEIAFTLLFGGFEQAFYDAYHAILPKNSDFESRIVLYQLYPLLVHANLFGGHYISRVQSIMNHFL